jgi:hypothetical protein
MRNELPIQFPGLTLEPLEPLLAESGFVMVQLTFRTSLLVFTNI